MKTEVIKFLNANNVGFTDEGAYLQVIDKPIRIYTVDDAYEYRTAYYADTGGVSKDHFRDTSIANEAAGIRTIWIKPWEFLADTPKRAVVESIILTAAGQIHCTFNGRDTEVREVTTKELRPFLEQNSFYGFRGSSIALGLYLKKDVGEYAKGTLLMVYTFGHPFFGGKKKKYDVEVIRAATLRNTQVRGGASKLFKHFVTNFPVIKIGPNMVEWNTICYYVDYDHNSGNSLPHLGFTFEKYAGPGFMNVTTATGKATHREPARHAEIMRLIREGDMYSVFNAGVKVFTYTKGGEVKAASTFIAE